MPLGYVRMCIAALLATAVASAHNWMGVDDITAPLTSQLEAEAPIEGAITEHRAHVLAADTAGNLNGRVLQFENEAKDLKGLLRSQWRNRAVDYD